MTPLFSYLDPATGSLLLQGLLATVFAVAFAVKTKWQQLKAFFASKSGDNEGTNADES